MTRRFHDLLNRSCSNRRLFALISGLRDQVSRYRSVLLKIPGMAEISIAHHQEMIKALKKKDRENLKKLAYRHVMEGKEIVMAEIRKSAIKS